VNPDGKEESCKKESSKKESCEKEKIVPCEGRRCWPR
jgi:hypothetical protein